MTLKDDIVHESMKLFSLNGFLSTGIKDILEASGTSKGGFYNYFSSKEELFFLVLKEAQAVWRQRVLGGIREIDSPTEKIKQMLLNYQDRYLQDTENFPGGCIFITLSVELDDQRPHLMKKLNEGFEGFKALLKRVIVEGIEVGELSEDINVEQFSNMLFTCMLGASVLYGTDKSTTRLKSSTDALINYLESHRLQGFQS